MTKIYLCVPFTSKDNAKKHGAKYDGEEKRWYVEDSIPEELIKYTPKKIVIDYEDKEIYKQKNNLFFGIKTKNVVLFY